MAKAKAVKVQNSREEELSQVSAKYAAHREAGEDLRYMEHFEFITTEAPRITKKSELDKRYLPTKYKKDGTLDKRYKEEKLD